MGSKMRQKEDPLYGNIVHGTNSRSSVWGFTAARILSGILTNHDFFNLPNQWSNDLEKMLEMIHGTPFCMKYVLVCEKCQGRLWLNNFQLQCERRRSAVWSKIRNKNRWHGTHRTAGIAVARCRRVPISASGSWTCPVSPGKPPRASAGGSGSCRETNCS